MDKSIKIIFALLAYAIAMAAVEAAVVAYLRELYYPSGFFIQSAKDLVVMPARILGVCPYIFRLGFGLLFISLCLSALALVACDLGCLLFDSLAVDRASAVSFNSFRR